ncbi:MAG: hypothetical protein N2V78_09215 [Methanophagales archaeon]|nr:hypothetical protein [Methanophagales archaeon]
MESIIRLFKAVEIEERKKQPPIKSIMKKTIQRGFIFSSDVFGNYSEKELEKLIEEVTKVIGLSGEQMNKSFHKSWQKVRDASIEQLVIEQIIHYLTTYGFEHFGIYDKDSVYIPSEKLEIPELKDGINLIIIKGYTKEEIRNKLLSLLQSGIALGENTIRDVADIATYLEIGEKEIETIRNKEVKVILYGYLDIVPSDPIEFLRYAVYKATDRTLLIKNRGTIEEIKAKKNIDVLGLFVRYKRQYGLEKLSQVFLRYKPIFLAFRTNRGMRKITNRLRKLAVMHHKPMREDYLNAVTAKIKKGEEINKEEIIDALNKANVFRKIRLAYALNFRTKDVDSILYRIRNGKGYATDFDFNKKKEVEKVFSIVMESIVKDVEKNVRGKRIYIPTYITYALPATEKQFTGDFPSGTFLSVPTDMVFGIHWENTKNYRVDIDLSLVGVGKKIGWDVSYRTKDRSILFSGDLTDAPPPDGASELFYVKKNEDSSYILFANYYNYQDDVEVPLKIFVAKEEIEEMSKNYMVNPNNILVTTTTVTNQKSKVLGLVTITPEECKFYFAETYLGVSITSSSKSWVENARKFLFDYYTNTISLNDVLEKAGCEMVESKEECDIDLSPENMEKDKIINLLR